MAVVAESSSASPNPSEDKPVIVRVKRKALQSPLDAFWLEINERPAKRPLLDFEKLSMSDSAGKGNEPLVDSAGMAEELKTKKVLVQHVETVSSFGTSVDVVKSFLDPNSGDVHDRKTKIGERKYALRKENQKQDLILSKARQRKEVVAKNARFEQIWRSRRGNKETSHENLHEICHVYDVIRVDVAEKPKDEISLEDQKILNSYLPLLREFIPSAASEIESDLYTNSSKQDSEDEYVYDLYAVKEESDMAVELSSNPFPLVQVDDEDFYDGPDESEYESDDSNAENNPLNDYPDEISEEEKEESENEDSDDESEEKESSSDKSSEPEDLEENDFFEDDIYDENNDGHDFDYDVDPSDDGEDRNMVL
ncbi:RNA-directed DNA methylation 4-like isoform X1 [Malus sylvestris]|uniref:RNA-directed DNA methylation 4-like isoform X1 n=1 Tax=Malus sylvestris TaxID=3752 RepID=UPI0021ACAC8F|nr:RNA-directed DNA methylation 4-like isoform X1 [Malus sylvestris]XP_050141395.1 RNA-directed DNA methylation 4-like isoform X1 [Malus sylvestris]